MDAERVQAALERLKVANGKRAAEGRPAPASPSLAAALGYDALDPAKAAQHEWTKET